MNRCFIPIINYDGRLTINSKYIEFIINNGYEPRPLFFPITKAKTNTNSHLEAIESDFYNYANPDDVLLIPGGRDIDPVPFGFRNVKSENTDRERDRIEAELIKIFMQFNVPVFGICRGFQLFFISEMGSEIVYWQHINGHVQENRRHQESHFVDLKTNLLDQYKKYPDRTKTEFGRIPVNSLHHQAIEMTSLRCEGLEAEIVGVVEEEYSRKNVTIVEAARVFHGFFDRLVFAGVQWHPEELYSQQNLINVMLER